MKPTHYLIIILLICIALLAFGLFYFKDRAASAAQESSRKDSIIREKEGIIQYRTNENGKLIAEKAAALLTTNELKEFYDAELKEIKKEMGINAKNLKAFVKAEFQARGEGDAHVTTSVDPETGEEMTDFEFDDSFLSFKSRIISGETTAPSQYMYTDQLTYAFHVKRDHWWSKEQLYGSGMLSNPNAKITSATNVLVDNYKDKRWGIGVAAGYGVFVHDNEVKTGPGVMVSVHRTIIKF